MDTIRTSTRQLRQLEDGILDRQMHQMAPPHVDRAFSIRGLSRTANARFAA